MTIPIKFKRGLAASRVGITPASGEPVWDTDDKKLYVGDGSTAGGIAVGSAGIEVSDTTPTDPDTGTGWLDTGTTGELYVYDGSVWVGVTGGNTDDWTVVTSATNAYATDCLIGDTTSSAFTITFPLSPSVGDTIKIKSTVASTNNLTLGRNGANFYSTAADFVIDSDYVNLVFVYVSASIGWIA